MTQPTKTSSNNAKLYTIEATLTVIMLGFISAGLLGGANLMKFIHLPEHAAHVVGAMLIAYVIVITATAVHLGVKFALKKGE